MNAMTKSNTAAVTAEQVLVRGDLSALNEGERIKYYADVCHSVGLNPLTKPFEYITLNGKLRLYALKDCTDQLRSIHGVSVTEILESEREGVFVVKAKVVNAQGRTDVSTGAVNIAGLKGEALANALMKAETKAKRRATLSICGLGMLDETETEDIPRHVPSAPAVVVPSPPPAPKAEAPVDQDKPVHMPPFRDEKIGEWAERFIASIETAKNPDDVNAWVTLNQDYLNAAATKAKKVSTAIKVALADKQASFQPPKEDPITSGPQPKKSDAPDIEKDYEAWMTWAFFKVGAAETVEQLDEFCATEVDPYEKVLFPPDYNDLTEAIGKRQQQLAGE